MRGGDRSISEYTLCFRYLMLDHELENLYFPRTPRWRDTLRRFYKDLKIPNLDVFPRKISVKNNVECFE